MYIETENDFFFALRSWNIKGLLQPLCDHSIHVPSSLVLSSSFGARFIQPINLIRVIFQFRAYQVVSFKWSLFDANVLVQFVRAVFPVKTVKTHFPPKPQKYKNAFSRNITKTYFSVKIVKFIFPKNQKNIFFSLKQQNQISRQNHEYVFFH